MGLIYKIVLKHFSNYDIEDYIQQGVISFLNLLDKYDPSKNTKVTTFAYVVIKNDLMDYTMRNNSVANPVNRKVQNKIVHVGDDNWIIDENSNNDENVLSFLLDTEYLKWLRSKLTHEEYKSICLLKDGYKIHEIKKITGLNRGDMNRLAEKINKMRNEYVG